MLIWSDIWDIWRKAIIASHDGGKKKTKKHNQEGIRFHGRGGEGVDLHLCVSNQAQVSRAEHGGKHHCCLPTILGPVLLREAEHFPDHSADDSSLHATPISVVQLWWPLLLVASQHWSPNLSLHPGFFVRSSRNLWSNWNQKKNSLLALTTCSNLQLGCP